VKVLLQQQYLSSHSVAAVRLIINTVKNPGFQPHFQQCQQQYLQSPRLQALQQPIPQSQASGQPQFDPIPMKYAELLPGLLKKNLVQTRPPPRGPKKFLLPAGYRPDLSCTFHQGAPGHDIEQCFAFRIVVQKLIEADLIPFEEFGFEYAS